MQAEGNWVIKGDNNEVWIYNSSQHTKEKQIHRLSAQLITMNVCVCVCDSNLLPLKCYNTYQ